MDREQLQRLSFEEKRALLKEMLIEKTSPQSAEQGMPDRVVTGLLDSDEYGAFLDRKEQALQWGAADLYFHRTDGISGHEVILEGEKKINFSSYNYLGLAGDPRVREAAREAIDRFGTSSSASRIASGEKDVHLELERSLASFLGTDDAIAMVGGFATNESTIGHLMNEHDLILYDSLIHSSIQQGALLSGATVRPFPHNRPEALEKILKQERHRFSKALIIVEGVYSMDGDFPDLPAFVRLKKDFRTMLMVDEAHSIGVLGKTGRGIGEHFQVDRSDVDIWMGTLSKSLASCGGYLAGTGDWIEYLKYTVPGFFYSVGLPPASAAAATEALRIIEEEPDRVERLRKNSNRLREALRKRERNIGAGSESAVIPLILGSSPDCIRLSKELLDHGIFVVPIIFPAVPENAARLRFFTSCDHTEEELETTVSAIESCLTSESSPC